MATTRFAMTAIVISISGAAWAQAPIPTQNISGIVLGADKKPVAGAKVHVSRFDSVRREMAFLSPVTTGADGRFAVEGQRGVDDSGPSSAMIYVDAPNHLLARAVITSDKPNEITLAAAGGIVRGTVVDLSGKPVAGVTVELTVLVPDAARPESYVNIPDPLAERFRAKTNAAGAWEIRNVPATGKASVSLADGRFVRARGEIACVPEAAPTAKTRNEPLVARPASAITGTVLLPDGQPAANVSVNVSTRVYGDGSYGSTKTGPDGTFRIGMLGKGTFVLSVSSPDTSLLAPKQSGIVVTDGTVTALKPLTLGTGTPVSGTIVDAKTGAGIAGVWVYTRGAQDDGGGWDNGVETDKSGAFVLHALPGEHMLGLGSRDPRYTGMGRTVRLQVKSAVPLTVEPIRLEPAPAVRLTVADESGQPVANVRLGIVPSYYTNNVMSEEYMGALTDASGAWDSRTQSNPEIAKTGEYQVQVAGDWEVVSPKSFPLAEGDKPLPIVLRRIDPAKRGVGRVTTPDGKPLASVQVSVVSERLDANNNQQDYQSAQVRSDARGEYILPPVKPGNRVGVSAQLDGYRAANGEGTPATESTPPRVPDLVLVPLDGVFRGTVSRGKTPVAGAQVWSLDGDERTWAQTDAQGDFVLKRVPGKGAVTVSAGLGRLTAGGVFTSGEKVSLSLAPVEGSLLPGRIPLTPAAAKAQAVRDKARAMELLRDLAKEAAPSKGARHAGAEQDLLANLLSPRDFEAAMRFATGPDGKITDQAWTGLIERRIPADMEAAAAAFQKQLPNFREANTVFYVACNLGLAYVAKQPQKALEYYRLAARTFFEKKQDDQYAAQRLATLAFHLQLPDADVAPVLELLAGGVGKPLGEWVLVALASGDGVRAAKRVAELPKEQQAQTLYRIVEAMAPNQPIEARRLLENIPAQGDGDDWLRGRAVVAVVKATAPFDAEAAYNLARTARAPYRSEALAHAASGVTSDAVLRAKRFVEATAAGNEGYERSGILASVAAIAERSAPDAAKTVRKALREAITGESFWGGNSVGIARVLLPDVPELCQRILEISMKGRRRINPGHASDYGMLRRELRALALLNPDRALQIAGELKQKDALFQMKMDIALILLTPPQKRLALLDGD